LQTSNRRCGINHDLITHDIYADNLLLGKSLFFSLRLSPDWNLAPGVGRPEIVALHERLNKKWVATGDAWYVVYHNEFKWALELAVKIRPLRDVHQGELGGEPVAVNHHPGWITWKHKQRGLPWNRHTVTFMTVSFHCPTTDRQVNLEFSGWCPQEGFDEILQAVQHLGCH